MIGEKQLITQQYKKTSIAILQENLSAVRAKANISQEKLATFIGISRQTYYGIETGQKEMAWTIFIALIFYFYSNYLTKEMLYELKIYPIELVMNINGEL